MLDANKRAQILLFLREIKPVSSFFSLYLNELHASK